MNSLYDEFRVALHSVWTRRWLVLGVAWGICILGWLAIVVGATSVLPQTVHVLRVPVLTGVSVSMYGLLSVAAASWAVYGVLIGDPLVVLTNLLVLPCAAVVVTRTWVSQRQELAAIPFDKKGAADTLKIYLGAA